MPGPISSRPRQIVRPDAVLRGDEMGTGPTFLLLHAGGERRRVWAPVSRLLAEAGFRCVAYDQRGHGDSGGSGGGGGGGGSGGSDDSDGSVGSDGSVLTLAACADDVAAMLGAEPAGCVVVGASLGGLAAVAALADPAVRAKVSGLVLVDVVPCLDPVRVRRFLAAGGLDHAYTELVDDILAHVSWLRQITAELDLPILLVRGDHGSAVTDDDLDQLLSLAPSVTVRTAHGAGHLIARERPVTLAEYLRRFRQAGG
jgi:pimeloyl-ACP methyl ester carboxylesterase